MPRLTPIELDMANLRGDFPVGAIGYISKEDALNDLRTRTGQDFGTDLNKWEDWLATHPEPTPEKAKSVSDAIKLARKLK